MPIYMTQFTYTPEAWSALIRNPVDRREGIRAMMQQLGGRLIEMYYSLGEYDGLVLLEAPDDTSATAGVVAAIGAGHHKTFKATKLLTVEEMLQALRKAGELSFQAPSG
jgi:uncharacterized protein with GYD domain